jgi:hypothetical protein
VFAYEVSAPPPPTAEKTENLDDLVDVVRGDQSMALVSTQMAGERRRLAELCAQRAEVDAQVANQEARIARMEEEFHEAQRVRAKYGLPAFPTMSADETKRQRSGRPSYMQFILEEMERRFNGGPWPAEAGVLWKELHDWARAQWKRDAPTQERIERILRAARRDLMDDRPVRRARCYQPRRERRRGVK